MTAPGWSRMIWVLLYSVQFADSLDEAAVDRQAQVLLLEPVRGLTREEEYAAIRDALASGARLTEILAAVPHTEEAFREFLARLLERMDSLRPWPELPFLVRDGSGWPAFAGADVIARIDAAAPLEDLLRRTFGTVDDDGRPISALILGLSSGDEVAVARIWRPGSEDVALLWRPAPPREAHEVLEAFLHVTALTPGEVADLTGGLDPLSGGGAGTGMLAHALRLAAAKRGGTQAAYEVFLRTRLFCRATGKPGVVAVGPPGAGLVPAFTSPALAAREGEYFSTTGADLLGLLPDGYAVLVDPGSPYAGVFAKVKEAGAPPTPGPPAPPGS